MKLSAFLAVPGLALVLAFSGQPAAARVGSDITLDHGSVWDTFKKGASTEGFFQIHNVGAVDDTLTAVDCTIGFATQLVDAKGNVIPSLVIPAGQTVTLSPGGTHINIIGMRYKVDDGAVVPCAVSFTNNGDVGAYLNAVREPAQN